MAENMIHIRDCFYYNNRFKVLICDECKFALNATNIISYLKNSYYIPIFKTLNTSEKTDFYEAVNYFDYNNSNNITNPEPFTEYFDFLKDNIGYACKQCNFAQINIKSIKIHLNKSHAINLKYENNSDYIYENITLQTFFTQKRDVDSFISAPGNQIIITNKGNSEIRDIGNTQFITNNYASKKIMEFKK